MVAGGEKACFVRQHEVDGAFVFVADNVTWLVGGKVSSVSWSSFAVISATQRLMDGVMAYSVNW